MSVTNPWLNPYQRSYNSIKEKLVEAFRAKVPEVTDTSEGNILVLILSAFAAIAEVLHYYIDNMARETFFPTARRYSSLVKHARLVDYHIKSAVPATTDVVIYKSDNSAFESDNFIIPVGTEFISKDGKKWYSTKVVRIYKGEYSGKVPLIQREDYQGGEYIDFGTVTTKGQSFLLPDLSGDVKYAEGTMNLRVSSNADATGWESWREVESFAYANSVDKVYRIEPDATTKPSIYFGDDTFGKRPYVGTKVRGKFKVTYGALGNIPENSFSDIPASINSLEKKLAISHPQPASGGSNYEDFAMLKDHVPLSIKLLGVAITREDFEARAKLVPGVNKAYVEAPCGSQVKVYISPDDGVQSSEALLDSVTQELLKTKLITTALIVYSTKPSQVYLDISVTGKKSFIKEDIQDQVIKSITEAYNRHNSDINKIIRLSDLYGILESCSLVDFSLINKLYQMSYPLPLLAGSEGDEDIRVPALEILSFVQDYYEGEDPAYLLEVTMDESGYTVKEQGKDTTKKGTFGSEFSWSDSRIQFTWVIGNSIPYTPGTIYQISLGAMNTDLTPFNYNMPLIEAKNIRLTIHEQV